MTYIKKSIGYIYIVLLIFSCNTSTTEPKGDNNDIVTIGIGQKEGKESVLFPDTLFGDYDCIALETNERSLIGNIDEISQFDNKYFILDKKIAKAIFLFDTNGSFIKKIHKLGKGPGEFIKIECVNFNEDLKRIELFDSELMKIIFYDFQGEYINEIQSKINFDGFTYNSSDSAYYFYSKFIPNNYDDCRLVIMDKDFNLIKGLLPYDKNLATSALMSISYFYKNTNRTYFLEPYSNTIYELKNRSIVPKYYIDFEKNKIPDDFLESEIFDKFNLVKKNKYSYVTDFIISPPYIYMEYDYKLKQYSFQYSKANGKSTNTIFGTIVHKDLFSISSIDEIVNDSVIISFDLSLGSQRMIDQIKNTSVLGQEIRKRFNSSKSINPLILKCKIKEQ